MAKYEVVLYWSAEEDAFVAEVPELDGCKADGATLREAMDNVEAAIEAWLDRERITPRRRISA